MRAAESIGQDNRDQIIRKDARGCFVEIKSDCFRLDKVHMQFVAYDTSKPVGARYTNNVHIYIDIPEFLVLAQEAANGSLHVRMREQKTKQKQEPLYEHMGGTSAKKLAFYGRARSDGKSLSRILKLTAAAKADYFLTADSGPGEENQTGLIVPRFGRTPEQHVSVILSWVQLNELLFTTVIHYQAWLSAQYAAVPNILTADGSVEDRPQRRSQREQATGQPTPTEIPAPSSVMPAGKGQKTGFRSAFGRVYGREKGSPRADDAQMF